MIYIIDRSSVGDIHVMFNAAMIKVFLSAYPESQIIFIGEEKHIDYVKLKLGTELSNKVQFQIESIIKSTGTGFTKVKQWIQKMWADYRFMNRIFKEAERKKALIYFCSIPPISLRFLIIASKKNNAVKVINTLHGELETVFESKNKREEMIGNMYRQLFKQSRGNLYHLLLNKISKQPLIEKGFLKENSILEITHPYFYQHKGSTHSKIADTLKLGHVGSLGIRKNGQLLYALAEKFRTQINDQTISFSAIGIIEPNVIPYKNEYVKDFASNGAQYLDRNIFEQKISELDYALFFYGPDQFIFRASGAIFDVIEYEKPIIVLKHPYFDYLFAEAGNIGFMCNTLEDMEQLTQRLINRDETLISQYSEQQKNIAKYRSSMDIIYIAQDLKQQLSLRNITIGK